jgi:hypothetical protein
MPGESEKPRLIIDEDWKSKVQSEKEALQQAAKRPEAEPPQPGEAPAGPGAATLAALFSSLATEALMCLGQVAHPETGQAFVDLDHAHYLIDTLQVLQEKTQGNRTPEESSMLSGMLHELRVVYVQVERHLQAAALANPKASPR